MIVGLVLVASCSFKSHIPQGHLGEIIINISNVCTMGYPLRWYQIITSLDFVRQPSRQLLAHLYFPLKLQANTEIVYAINWFVSREIFYAIYVFHLLFWSRFDLLQVHRRWLISLGRDIWISHWQYILFQGVSAR